MVRNRAVSWATARPAKHGAACESLRPLPPPSLTTSAETTEVEQRRQPATMTQQEWDGKKSNFGIFLFCSFLLKSVITHHHHHKESKQLNFYVS